MGIVTLTQFVHPYGERRETSVELPDDVCEMAKKQVLTCEMMPNDYSKVVFYSYPVDTDPDENPEVEECMFADMGPGDNSPALVLERLICLVDSENKVGSSRCSCSDISCSHNISGVCDGTNCQDGMS
jgi:hypothetical protein